MEGGTAHRYSIIEVDYSLWGAPLPPYIKEQGGRGGQPGGGAPGGALLPPGVGLPPFPCWIRRRGKEKEERKERGGAGPLPLSYSD